MSLIGDTTTLAGGGCGVADHGVKVEAGVGFAGDPTARLRAPGAHWHRCRGLNGRSQVAALSLPSSSRNCAASLALNPPEALPRLTLC
jgi:hypothetical protein